MHGGGEDHAERSPLFLQQADHHHELAVSIDELARAIQRIDEEHALGALIALEALGVALLGHDRDFGKRLAEPLADQIVGAAIGNRHRIARALVVDAEGLRRKPR